MKNARLARYAWGVLAYNLLVILWGAWVRVTGSGAGCGSHWPMCNGEVIPRTPTAETVVEFTHRLTSGLDLVLVAALVVWVFRVFARGTAERRAAAWSGVFLILEALLGAGLVLFELVAGDTSAARAPVMSLHLVNTMMLLTFLARTAWLASGGRTGASWRGASLRPLWLALGGLILVVITGGIAALGDTLFPATSLAEGLRQDIAAGAHFLVRLRVLHPFVAVAASVGVLAAVAGAAARVRTDRMRLLAGGVGGLVIAQLVAGVLNVALLAPGWLQLVHLLLADVVWIGLTLVLFEVQAVGEPAGAEAPAVAGSVRAA